MEYTSLRILNRGYMKLDVWQKSMQLSELDWGTALKAKLDFKLRSQLLDAAQSVTANFAQGDSRCSFSFEPR